MRLFLVAVLLIGVQSHTESDNPQRATNNKPSNNCEPAVVKVQGSAPVETAAGQNQQQATKAEVKPFMTHGEYVISVITAAYAIIAYFSLRAIKRQADIAKIAADSVRDTECAIVSVYPEDFTLGTDHKKTAVSFRVHNLGRTIAISFATEHLLQVGDSVDDPPMPSLFEPSVKESPIPDYIIPPDKDSPKTGAQDGVACTTFLSTVDEPMMGNGDPEKPFHFVRLTDSVNADIQSGIKFLWSYGFVRYRDIFKRQFELRFCHRYEPKLMPHGGFIVAGSPEFNRLTPYGIPARLTPSWRKAIPFEYPGS